VSDIILSLKQNREYNIFEGFQPKIYNETLAYFYKRAETEEDLKSFKVSYDWFLNTVKKKILSNDDNFKLVQMYELNYGAGIELNYDYKDQKYAVRIPNFFNTNALNYENILEGYAILKIEGNCLSEVINGLDYQEVAMKFQALLKVQDDVLGFLKDI
jgi:hypothetical protein